MANNGPLRVLYAGPFYSRAAAVDRIEALFAGGEVSECDKPDVIRYGTGLRGRGGDRNHWHITILAGEG